MNSADIVTMIGNLSRSLESVDYLVAAMSYLIGLVMIISGIMKLKKVALSGGRGQDHYMGTIGLIAAGAALLFLPTTIHVMSYTLFGSQNILSYANYNSMDIFQSMGILIKTVGLIWFVRGCVMLVHAGEPGEDNALKGLVFMIFGIFAMNFVVTLSYVSSIVSYLITISISYKK